MKKSNSMMGKLFFKLMPVQAMIVTMGSINSLVDGAVAGRFIDAKTVGVIGLFSVIFSIINAISSVILGGCSVFCGRYMGSGELEKTNGVFSLNVTVTSSVAIVATLLMLIFPGPLGIMCGADETLMAPLKLYILGYSFGVLPMMMAQQMAYFLQVERQLTRSYIGIAAMIISNIVLNVTFVVVFHMGILGLAISTSLCNWIYFLVLVSYYFTGKGQLKFSIKSALWDDLGEIIKVGSPGALLVLCLGFRDLVLNRILIRYAGADGVAARASLNMIAGLFLALCLGGGSVIRMLASISIGEEDKDSVKELLKVALTKVMGMCFIITVVVIFISKWVVLIFFPDPNTEVYKMAYQYFIMFDISIPLIMLVQIETNYLQAMKQNICVHIFSIMDGFASVVIPSLILTPIMGVMGVWVSTPIGIVLSATVYPIYAFIYWKRMPKNIDEWLLFEEGFGVSDKDRFVINIRNMEDVSTTSDMVQKFCGEHDFGKKTSMYCALCLEEMARNAVEHGFSLDKKEHFIDARIVCTDEKVILRIKDDCQAFDPVDMSERLDSDDPTKNIGIRMVMRIADEASYQSVLGLNVITIEFNRKKTA